MKTQIKKPEARVVIVGGGYAGTAVAKLLDDECQVTLLEKKDAFFHNVGALRAVVDGDWIEKLFIPYDRLLKRGRVIHDTVAEVSPEHILLESGKQVGFDYAVLATGSNYPFPAKMPSDTAQRSTMMLKQLGRQVQKAERILIIGGGPVGVEFAGEIMDYYPQKSVTLVHSGSNLIGSPFKFELGHTLLEKLRAKGVRVLLNERVDTNSLSRDSSRSSSFQPVNTDKGTKIETELYFLCDGGHVNNSSVISHFHDVLDQQGHVRVNEYFQIDGYENIFAIGDLCDVKEPKMAYYSLNHAEYVADTILRLQQHNGAEKELKAYTPDRVPQMLISLGRKDGVSQLSSPEGKMLGASETADLKSKSLLVEFFRERLGVS